MTSARPLWAGRALALVGIVLVAANLRTAVVALSPITDHIADDIALSSVGLGLLGTLPPLCFAIASPLVPLLRRRLELEPILLLGIAGMIAGQLVRAVAGEFVLLAVGSVIAFLSTGVANVALPPTIKRYFPDRIGLVTSLFVTIMSVSTLIPPLLAVSFAEAAGWRASIGSWAVLAVAALVPWVALIARNRPAGGRSPDADGARDPAPRGRGLPAWRSSIGWALALLIATSAINLYSCFAWLPSILTELGGVTAAEAAGLLALYAAIGIPTALVVPFLAVRLPSIWPILLLAFVCNIAGTIGLLLAPSLAPLWMVLAAFGPTVFPLTLVLVNTRSRTGAGSVALSSFAQGVGYLVGAVGPVLLGFLHELSGAWALPLAFLAATSAIILFAGLRAARPVTLEDELAARTDRRRP